MDYTSRMLRLLGAVRREMNGEVVDSMRYYGAAYGLNYGVSLHTVRAIARAEQCDHDFARYIYQQDIRELRLAAFWIADPERLTADEAQFWGTGILNSEMAEEAAFAFVGRAGHMKEIYEAWTAEGQPLLLQYTALLAAARSECLTIAFLDAATEVVRRNPDDRLTAQGMVTLLAALVQKEESRDAVLRILGSLGASPSADFIHEEIAWRLEV